MKLIIILSLLLTGCASIDWGLVFTSAANASHDRQQQEASQPTKPCPDCFGSGIRAEACRICGGSGNSYGYNCYTCRGTGKVGKTCPKCDGTGRLRY